MSRCTRIPSDQRLQPALSPNERDLASILADMLVADVLRERCEREGEPTVTKASD
jgi:hypothetical protein